MEIKNQTQSIRIGVKPYNPNRFNAFDSALCFIITLLSFVFVPIAIKNTVGGFLESIYLYDTYAYLCINIALSQSIILAVAFIYSRIRRTSVFDGGGYKLSWDGVHVLMAVMLTMGIMMLFYFTHLQFSEYTGILVGGSQEIEEHLSPFSVLFMLLYLFEVAVFPAVIEEMLFRGIIMRGLEQFGSLFAVICSSAMFSLMHGNFSQIVLQFIGGLAIGGVVMVTKNYLLGMIMHFVNNAFSTVYTFLITVLFENPIYENVIAVSGSATIILGVIFTLVGAVYFISMLFNKEKNKILGKNVEGKYEKKRYYLIFENGEQRTVKHTEIPNLRDKNQPIDKLYFINGRFRPINKLASPTVSYILLGLGVAFSVFIIFFGL